ncbi:MAG TPA: dihydroxyacetone kinase subunit DhaL [Candidatus Binatia bacterium]|jgi:dihydroxyacetone kinase-like protein|nr:dihydroxyacetone kinase subunit DhaL [Candidatus Binatia bacterium]
MGGVLDAASARRWLETAAARIAEEAPELTALDAAIGDGDHGTNMDRGFKAVADRVLSQDGEIPIDDLCKQTGMALLSTVGGAAGPLYGTWFLRFGTASAGKAELTLEDVETALAAAVEGVRQRGKAEPGDKTMVDALEPALEALQRCRADGASPGDALRAAADAAEEGSRATTPLVARKGRASYLGERSAGHQDPGATSSALLLRALAEVVAAP